MFVHFRPVLSLLFLVLLPLCVAWGRDSLSVAKEALRDHRPELAETYARAAAQAQSPTDDSLEVVILSLLERKNPEAVLWILKGEDPDFASIPTDERPALWKSAALHLMQEREQAIRALQEALPTAPTNVVLELRRNMAPLLLQSGATNDALQTYAELCAETSGPTAASNSLERARIFFAQALYSKTLDELATPKSPLLYPETKPAARSLEALSFLHLGASTNALDILLETVHDPSPENAPYRADACLQAARILAQNLDPEAIPLAAQAIELAPDTLTEFQALQLSAHFLFKIGRAHV